MVWLFWIAIIVLTLENFIHTRGGREFIKSLLPQSWRGRISSEEEDRADESPDSV